MPEQQPNQTQGDIEAKLKGLERLRLSGLITEERYETMRSQLLAAASQAMAAPPAPQPAAPPAPAPAAAAPAPPSPPPPPAPAASTFERYTPQPPRAETAASTTYQPPLPPPIPAASALPAPTEAAPPPVAPTPPPPPAAAAPTPPQPAGYHSTYHSAFPSGPPSTVPRYVPPDQRQPEPVPAPLPVAPPPPPVPVWGAPPARPAAPSARNRSLILAGIGSVILLAAGGIGALVLTGHSTSSSSTSSTLPSEAPVSTPVPTSVPKAIRDAYLAAVNPLGQSWAALDKAFKTAESKPCSSCPPGTFDITPVIPALRDVYLAYKGSIDELGVIEARLDGTVQSDVGGLITSERRALVAFENALTTTNSTLDTAGALTRSNDEIQQLDNVVRKDMGLTPAPPVT